MTTGRRPRFDWTGFEDELTRGLVASVTAVRNSVPDGRHYAAALFGLYAEAEGVVCLPLLGVGDEDALDDPDDRDRFGARWDVAAWDAVDHDWPGDRRGDLEAALTAEACRSTPEHWDRTHARFRTTLTRACRAARTELVTAGTVEEGFLVVLQDDDADPDGELLRSCLTPAQVRRHFPWLDAAQVERDRIAGLPEDERARAYVSLLDGPPGPVSPDEARAGLRGLGDAAVNALVPLLTSVRAWEGAMLLADLGVPHPDALAGLRSNLSHPAEPTRLWAARALVRLGALQDVLAVAPDDEMVATAVTAPLTSFADHGRRRPVLDYTDLERLLDERPGLEDAVEDELRPGRGYVTIRAAEVPTALAALGSPHRVVRWHAASVLGSRRLRRNAVIVPALEPVAAGDPDETVRRLAALSLRYLAGWSP